MPAWMDTEGGITGGDDWVKSLTTTLKKSRFVLVVITPNSLASKWFRRELEYADKESKPIFPIVVGEVNIPDWFSLRFSQTQWVEVNPESKQSIKDLIKNLTKFYNHL